MVMSKVEDIFDMERFREDVQTFRQRQGMTYTELYHLAGYRDPDVGTFRHLFPRSQSPIPFRMVILLAAVCDLSIDAYCITSKVAL